jgi:DNA-directed RNA polymerase specialized sigma24 family protein
MDQEVDMAPETPDWFTTQIQSPKLRSELINIARHKGVPADDCEDIVSEATLRAIRSQAKYDSGRGPFSVWIKAIAENVINSYWRRQLAQKRKAESGAISHDAASIQFGSSEDNRPEPKDASVEKQRASEEVQHFIDTASLSEKEGKAIASRRGKETEQTGAKFSPSTARRAVEKLKQAKRDEKFRECPRGPDASECECG